MEGLKGFLKELKYVGKAEFNARLLVGTVSRDKSMLDFDAERIRVTKARVLGELMAALPANAYDWRVRIYEGQERAGVSGWPEGVEPSWWRLRIVVSDDSTAEEEQ